MGLKNTDLQKNIEQKNTKIQELESEFSSGNSRLTVKHSQFDNNHYGFKSV